MDLTASFLAGSILGWALPIGLLIAVAFWWSTILRVAPAGTREPAHRHRAGRVSPRLRRRARARGDARGRDGRSRRRRVPSRARGARRTPLAAILLAAIVSHRRLLAPAL